MAHPEIKPALGHVRLPAKMKMGWVVACCRLITGAIQRQHGITHFRAHRGSGFVGDDPQIGGVHVHARADRMTPCVIPFGVFVWIGEGARL